ncbi:MAG: DUF4404 family protein [Porticoccaceae bacterium]
MDKRKSLAEELAALQEELARASAADPDLLTLVSHVVHDVTTLTGEPRGAGRGTLHARLEAQVGVFETDHPRIAAALRRVVDALADLGM